MSADDTPVIFDHGDLRHVDCHLGLVDAAAAVARMLLDRVEQALCLPCLAEALVLTSGEAEVAVARVVVLPGFSVRFGACVGCGRRGRVVRALRVRPGGPPAVRRRAAGDAQ